MTILEFRLVSNRDYSVEAHKLNRGFMGTIPTRKKDVYFQLGH